MKSRNSLNFAIFFWSVLVLAFDGFILLPAARELLATRFPSTEGTVLSSEVTEGESDEGTIYHVRVEYQYSVAGREYTAHRFRYGAWNNSHNASAHRVVAEHPPGRKVPVYYNPWFPQDAVLSTGIHGSDLFFLAFMTPFNFVMILLWRMGWEGWRQCRFKPVAGGIKIIREPRMIRARLTKWSPAGVAFGTIAGLAFAGVFICAFACNGDPSMPVALAGWSVILFCGALAGTWDGFRILSGKYDLIIDEPGDSLELPLTHKRKSRRRVSFQNVESVCVETTNRAAHGEQPLPNYAPTLVIGGDSPSNERLVEWWDEEKAQAFAAWLRERLPSKTPPLRELAGRF